MTPTTIATAADYADAMLTARRAKNWLAILLLLMLVLQITLFFLIRYDVIKLSKDAGDSSMAAMAEPAATQPTDDSTAVVTISTRHDTPAKFLAEYGNSLIVFLGMIFVILLAVVLMLLLTVMLVGRLIGVSQVTSAFIWAVLLALLLFPWQAFFDDPNHDAFRVPGALYTWHELEQNVHFGQDPSPGATIPFQEVGLKWARFVGFPALAIVLLLIIQARSSRGLRMALGESDVAVHVEEGTV